MKRDEWLVVAAFLVIFAFSTVDHAISPLVHLLSSVYGISEARTLWAISSCTAGIIIGIVVAPLLTRRWPVPRVAVGSSIVFSIGLLLFVLTDHFIWALACRWMTGLATGVISVTLWWYTYEGVSQKRMHAMLIVMMAARPLGVALGVPLVGWSSARLGWSAAFAMCLILFLIGAILLGSCSPIDSSSKREIHARALWEEYRRLWELPLSRMFFSGLGLCKCGYFGFYSLAGIWLGTVLGLSVESTTRCLFIIGISEASINFFIPSIMARISPQRLFAWSAWAHVLFLGLVLFCPLPLGWALVSFALFAMLDRISTMVLVSRVPALFPTCDNKSGLGSMMTLASWGSLTLMSWLEGILLPWVGMAGVAFLLVGTTSMGICMLMHVQKHRIVERKEIRL